jgi:hypothetical protein
LLSQLSRKKGGEIGKSYFWQAPVQGARRPLTKIPLWHKAFTTAVLVAKTLDVIVVVIEMVSMRSLVVVAATREIKVVVSR